MTNKGIAKQEDGTQEGSAKLDAYIRNRDAARRQVLFCAIIGDSGRESDARFVLAWAEFGIARILSQCQALIDDGSPERFRNHEALNGKTEGTEE